MAPCAAHRVDSRTVSHIEYVFFGLAILLPVGGGALLIYFIARMSKKPPKDE